METSSIPPSKESGTITVNIWKLTTVVLAIAIVAILVLDIKITLPFKSSSAPPAAATNGATDEPSIEETSALEAQVIPAEGFELPVKWADFGEKLTKAGVIDSAKLTTLYEARGGLADDQLAFLSNMEAGTIRVTPENNGFLLNMFWAFGLSNKNTILEKGPMQDPSYGGAEGFASTGGWSLSSGDPMDHYSKHEFIVLTSEQQTLVETVSKNIFRPCCNNSTYFPDCNHGMAMLGFLELMASQGATEAQMYDAALKLNSFWFPSTYVTVAKLMKSQGVSWDKVDPKTVLAAEYSSASGYKKVLQKTQPASVQSGGGGCSV